MQKMTAELNNRITRRGIIEGQIKSNAQIQTFVDRQKSLLIENLAVDSEEQKQKIQRFLDQVVENTVSFV